MRFLHIARGSCSELKTQLNIIKVLKYIENKEFNDIINKLIEVHKMLNGFIKTIEKQIEQKKL
ncbi:four helix bundle protein [Patescibacteria group bacterium]|nr:four helix bundle protein [Patescibacteria group bacterium]